MVISLVVIIFNESLFCQYKIEPEHLPGESNPPFQQQIYQDTILHDIISLYGPLPEGNMNGKLLSDSHLMPIPELSSHESIPLRKGETVPIYKFIQEKMQWLAQKDGFWGTIDGRSVLPLHESDDFIPDFVPFDSPPELARPLQLGYPENARARSIEGKVIVRVYIDKKGKVLRMDILKGIEELNEAALEAISNGSFRPAKFEGKNIGAWLTIPVKFTLNTESMF